jgi:hypothetical protein
MRQKNTHRFQCFERGEVEGIKIMLNDLLVITRDIEKTLAGQDIERLSMLLARRREIFAGIDPGGFSPEDETLLLEIRESEERCLGLAGVQVKQVQADLLAARRQRRLESAYSGGRVVSGK